MGETSGLGQVGGPEEQQQGLGLSEDSEVVAEYEEHEGKEKPSKR